MSDFLDRMINRSFYGQDADAVQPRPTARFETPDGLAWIHSQAAVEPEPGTGPSTRDPERHIQPDLRAPVERGEAGSTVRIMERADQNQPVDETSGPPPVEFVLRERETLLEKLTLTQEAAPIPSQEPQPVLPVQDRAGETPPPTVVRLERVERLLPPSPERLDPLPEPGLQPKETRDPEVRVTIGRIEVHAPQAAPPPARPAGRRPAPAAARPVRSLDDYLADRKERKP